MMLLMVMMSEVCLVKQFGSQSGGRISNHVTTKEVCNLECTEASNREIRWTDVTVRCVCGWCGCLRRRSQLLLRAELAVAGSAGAFPGIHPMVRQGSSPRITCLPTSRGPSTDPTLRQQVLDCSTPPHICSRTVLRPSFNYMFGDPLLVPSPSFKVSDNDSSIIRLISFELLCCIIVLITTQVNDHYGSTVLQWSFQLAVGLFFRNRSIPVNRFQAIAWLVLCHPPHIVSIS